jgi:ATP adenylyltransferase/5',5'''-P-1,P-4-tetraphosphate phosphorylase II
VKDRNFIMLCAIVKVNRNATDSHVGLVLHRCGASSTISSHRHKYLQILSVCLLPCGKNLRQCE